MRAMALKHACTFSLLLLLLLLTCSTACCRCSRRSSSAKPLKLKLVSFKHSGNMASLRSATLSTRSRLKQLSARKPASSKSFILDASFSVVNSFVVLLGLGTPVRYVPLLTDTGSDLTWLECAPCWPCITLQNQTFDPRTSSSFRVLGCASGKCQCTSQDKVCRYTAEYSDGFSSSGQLVEETMTFFSGNDISKLNLSIGCGYSESGQFGSAAAGVLGLGRGPASFVRQLGPEFGYVFATCFSFSDRSSGYLHFGTPQPVSYTPMLKRPRSNLYFLKLEGISVAGKLVDLPTNFFEDSGGTTIDTGSTITALNPVAFKKLVETIERSPGFPIQDLVSDDVLDFCFRPKQSMGDDEVFRLFPEITFHFAAGASVALSPDKVFLQDIDTGNICLFIANNQNASMNVFGLLQQQDQLIVYDQKMDRIGFAPAKCSQ